MDADDVRAALGSTSMAVMDVVDDVVVEQIKVAGREAARLKDCLVERGLQEPHAIQIVVSFITGAILGA